MGKLCKSLEMFHSEFLKPLALGMMNKLSYSSLHCAYGWQGGFVIFSAEDSSFILLAPIKILELQLFLDIQFPISSHICLKLLFPNPFKKCYHNITKSNLVFCNENQKKLLQNPRYEGETAKHKELNATQYKVGNTAALNTQYVTHTKCSLLNNHKTEQQSSFL